MDSSTISSAKSDKSSQALATLARLMNEQTELVTAMAAAANRTASTEEEAKRIAIEKEELARRVLDLQAQMALATEEASRAGSTAAGSTVPSDSTTDTPRVLPYGEGSTVPDGSRYGGGSSIPERSAYPASYGGGTFGGDTYQSGYSQAPRTYAGNQSGGESYAGNYPPSHGYPPNHHGHPPPPGDQYTPPMGAYPPRAHGGHYTSPPHDGHYPPAHHHPHGYDARDEQSVHSHRSSHSHSSRRSHRSHGSRRSHYSERGRRYGHDNRQEEYHGSNYPRGGASVHSGMYPSNHSRGPPMEHDDGSYSVASGRPELPYTVQTQPDDFSVGSFSSHRSGRSSRSNRSGRSRRSTGSLQSARSSGRSIGSGRSGSRGSSKKKKKRAHDFQPPVKEFVREANPPGSETWKRMSKAATCIVPDRLVPRDAVATKQAWREKVTICIIALMTSAFIVGGVGFLPVFFCRTSNRKTTEELKTEHPEWTVVFGNLYDFTNFGGISPSLGPDVFKGFRGGDASRLFPRVPMGSLPEFCISQNKTDIIEAEFSTPLCPDLTTEDLGEGHQCITDIVGLSDVRFTLEDYWKGQLVVPQWELQQGEEDYLAWLRVGTSIYNITHYINSLRDPNTKSVIPHDTHPNAVLHPALHNLVVRKRNQDATLLFEEVFKENQSAYQSCLDNLFYEARLDDRYDPACRGVGVLMYFLLFFIAGLLVVQVICSLLYLARKHRVFHEDDMQAAVMVMVPCYNEGENELSKTINSLLMTDYPVENKVMCIVADGVVTGSDEEFSTPEICAQILGFEIDFQNDDTHKYGATHEFERKRVNYAGVYTGTYTKEVDGQERQLKYIVIVKRGTEDEAGAAKPGNRGKRDSQLVLAGLFNRIHYNREPSELDIALVKSLFSLGLPAKDIEYLMCIDADTRVKEDSMSHMVYHLEHDPLILACCGETQVDNKSDTWVTMIQVFEYYSSHHLKKAFESVFGCVTCLPGCFTMYRVFTDEMKCLISNDDVYIDYARHEIPSLHEKNLFELGEDRMLTTLLLMHFPGMRLSFVPEAICWTIVPHTMKILLSQRRRWINSTFHNMYELLKVETMCGICCLSMKTVVVMDLIVTMILPASLIYIVYLTYLFASEPENIDTFILVFYAVTFGMQMVSFLVRARFDYLWWFMVFTFLGIPVFYFILPVYAFTNMDDFSWGKTRTVAGGGAEGVEGAEAPKEEADNGSGESPDTRGNYSGSEGGSVGSKRARSRKTKASDLEQLPESAVPTIREGQEDESRLDI